MPHPMVEAAKLPFIHENFRIEERLGKGSFGAVYRATHLGTGETVALKKVMTDDMVDSFKEIAIMREIDCDNLVRFFGSYEFDGFLWIVMEYCALGALTDMVQLAEVARLSEPQVASVAKAMLQGLAYMHSNGMIHRDIKPENVLITASGEGKLADFGVAGKFSSEERRSTLTGTPYYIAPEVLAESTSGYDANADVWSLGICCIEFAEGEPPHYDVPPMRVMLLIARHDPPTLKDPSSWSPDFNDFLKQCLTKDPAERPSSRQLLQHPFIQRAKPISVTMAGVIAEATRKIAELGGLEKAMKFLKKGKISEVTSPSGKTLLGHDDEDSSSSYYDISDMPPPPPLDEEAPPAAPSQAAPAAPRQIAPTMASPPPAAATPAASGPSSLGTGVSSKGTLRPMPAGPPPGVRPGTLRSGSAPALPTQVPPPLATPLPTSPPPAPLPSAVPPPSLPTPAHVMSSSGMPLPSLVPSLAPGAASPGAVNRRSAPTAPAAFVPPQGAALPPAPAAFAHAAHPVAAAPYSSSPASASALPGGIGGVNTLPRTTTFSAPSSAPPSAAGTPRSNTLRDKSDKKEKKDKEDKKEKKDKKDKKEKSTDTLKKQKKTGKEGPSPSVDDSGAVMISFEGTGAPDKHWLRGMLTKFFGGGRPTREQLQKKNILTGWGSDADYGTVTLPTRH